MTRTALALAAVAWLVVVLGGGAMLARHDASVAWSPALRLAGVDLIYALRRVAAGSDRLLLLDEVRPAAFEIDLGALRVDTDLPSAPVQTQLRQLQRETGRFEFRVDPDLIYVRSELSLDALSDFDRRILPGGTFKGDLPGLSKWVREQAPNVLLSAESKLGQPIFREIELQVPPKSTVLEVLTLYARAVDRGWRIRRAGQVLGEKVGDFGLMETTILGSSVELWKPLDEPFRITPARNENSTLKAIARISQREGIPVVVLDRTPLSSARGELDILVGSDPRHLRFPEAVQFLAGPQDNPHLRWEWSDGIAVVSGRLYDRADVGAVILEERLRSGRFRGSLGELARWINANRSSPSDHTLMGGEILPDDPVIELEIPEGATVREALEEFTRRTGVGWVFVAHDDNWSGGFLTYLTDWLASPDWTRL